ncbi:MAG: FtsX-like permease family protein [Bacteroidales bacterium]|nr:FtsX-like permease family protein [Bacteroidales bacterium]
MSNRKLISFVAWRYLFSHKRRSAINLITAISAMGVMVATMALVCVMSVLNGFEQMVEDAYCVFDPQLKIVPQNGETLQLDNASLQKALQQNNIKSYATTLQQQGLIMYDGLQMPVNVMGADNHFTNVVTLDSIMLGGAWKIYNDDSYAVVSAGITNHLAIISDYTNALELYVPKRGAKVNVARPDNAFRKGYIYVTGNFAVRQERFDENTIIIPLQYMQELYGRDSLTVSAVWIKLNDENSLKRVQREISRTLDDSMEVLNQQQQQKDYYRIMKIEKWITFLILAFILLIAVCNIIGSLSMLMIDKQKDIETLSNLGADRTLISHIFMVEGWMISAVGAVIGTLLGLALSIAQQHFGFIKMSTDVFAPSYPVCIKIGDIVLVFITVLTLGALAAYYPAHYLKRKEQNEQQ